MKKKNLKFIASLVVILSLGYVTSLSAQSTSLSSLLDEMTDRTSLTKVPNYVCKQASSYDRAAKNPDENWFANNDTAQFVREEKNENRTEWVLMEAEGPGAITRWWITAPHYKNNVYIYIDNNSVPTFEGKIADLVGGSFFGDAPLSEVTAGGRNLYLPLPFAQSIKITCDNMNEQGNLYYQIDYRLYDADVEVDSLSQEVLDLNKEKIADTCDLLLNPEKTVWGADNLKEVQGFSRKIESEQLEGLFDEHKIYGPGSITSLSVKLTAEDLAQAYRSTILSISFDGQETVWAPVGDFFGSGIGINPHKTWNTVVDDQGNMTCYWKMPFKHEARVSFINTGIDDVDVEYSVFYEKGPWTDDSMYFHANWRQEREIETEAGKGVRDWNYTALRGTGIYVGDVLAVYNPVEAWWGEGDEKIYVDGEDFPSHFGTGTEDYYGYAWGSPNLFTSPFHAQTQCEGPATKGNITNLRFRSLDGIPFTSEFRFDMEIFHWEKTSVDYGVTTFWYGVTDSEIDEELGPDRDELEDEAAEAVHQESL